MKLTKLVLILSLVTSVIAQDSDGEKPDNLLTVNPARDLYDFATLNYNSARDEMDPARKRSAYLSAAKAFDKFIRGYPRDPKSLEAWYFLGMSYRNLGEAKASRSCFETAATRWETGRLVEASALFLASDDYKAENWGNAARWFQIVAKTTKNPKSNISLSTVVFSVSTNSMTGAAWLSLSKPFSLKKEALTKNKPASRSPDFIATARAPGRPRNSSPC